MVQFSRSIIAVAFAVAALAVQGAAPARAADPLNNLGPVGPREPILVKVGDQRIIAFFVPERGNCSLSAVTWKDAGPDAPYASQRVRVELKPGQLVQLDGAQLQPLGLLCGADASSLAVTASAELILTGAGNSRK
jgi:hypothetical protein